MTTNNCDFYNNPLYKGYIAEYRGNFLEEIGKIDYACGDILTDRLATIYTDPNNIKKIRNDVPSITLIDFSEMYVLESISPSSVSNIDTIKLNPYLNLNGNGVLVGIIDTGIDYLNKEFMKEDGTTRILTLWDQNEQSKKSENLYIGYSYSEEEINNAISLSNTAGDPYSIVPQRDTIGHGTKISGIIGARGYNKTFTGVAPFSDFAIVKLKESEYFKKFNSDNGINNIPVYQVPEILAGIEYIRNFAESRNMPAVIVLALGNTVGSHDGSDILSNFINRITRRRPLVVVTGVGNEGISEGHASGTISTVGEIKKVELVIPSILKKLNLKVWIRRPNKMAINIISPSGKQSQFIKTRPNQFDTINFITENTDLFVMFFFPDTISGNQVISLNFNDIKPGIWTIELQGEYIVDGLFNIWLQPSSTLPSGTKFSSSTSDTTLSAISAINNIISVGYYNSSNNSILSSSGKGYPVNGIIKPDIIAPGINILTTNVGGSNTTVSGSSAATSITAGVCALLLQWAVIDENDVLMTPSKIRGYLISGANRTNLISYPNKEEGYGKLDIKGVFDIISSNFSNILN